MSPLKDWVSVTSWHGIDDLWRANSVFSKLIWLLIVIGTTTLILMQTYIHIDGYKSNLEHNPWVQTPVYKRQKSLPLPIINVCSTNKVSKASLRRLNMSSEAAAFIVELQNTATGSGLSNSGPVGKKIVGGQVKAFQDYVQDHAEVAGWNVYDWALQLTPNCESIAFLFHLPKAAITGQQMCNKAAKFSAEGYICYGFDLQDLPHAFIAGDLMGVTLTLNNNHEDYAPIMQAGSSISGAVRIYFGVGEYLGPGLGSGVEIPPSLNVRVTLTGEAGNPPDEPTFSMFPDPEWPCTKNKSLYILNADHTVDRCILDCYILYLYSKCQCNAMVFPVKDDTGYRFCMPEEAYNCSFTSGGVDEGFNMYLNSECVQSCGKSNCGYQILTTRVTGMSPMVNLTNTVATISTLSNMSLTVDMMQHMSQVSIYYESLVVKIVGQQLRASASDLISNIGGQMGIWAGVSIITIIQALFYATSWLTQTVKKCFHRQRNRKPNVSDPNTRYIEAIYSRRLGSPSYVSNYCEADYKIPI